MSEPETHPAANETPDDGPLLEELRELIGELGQEGVGAWSDTGSGQANRPPTASAVSLADATLAWKTSADYDVSDKFEDADGDTLTYAASAASPGVLTAAITGSGSHTLRVTVVNPASSTVTYAASDAYGGHVARTVTITGQASVTRAIAENSAAGATAGKPVRGTPYDDGNDQTDDALSYTLSGEASTSGAFEIDATTGQISVQQGATIDYESKTSYTGTVTWTVQGQAASASLTINVTNVTGPAKPAAPTVEAGATEPATSLDVSWTAPADLGSAITGYRVRYRTAGPTEWSGHTVTGTGTETTIKGLTAATIYRVQILAINAEGDSDWSDSGTGVTGPVRLEAEREVSEDAQPGDPVGEPVTATDPEGHALTYSVVTDLLEASGNSGRAQQQTGHFVIDPTTGQIRVAPGAHLDYETEHTHKLVVQATHTDANIPDGHIVDAVITVTIDVTDVQELLLAPVVPTPPTPALELDAASREVAENAPGNAAVGAPVAARGGNGDPLSYSLSGSGAFTIDASTGQIRVATGAVLDHESTQSYSVTVSVTGGAATVTAEVTITVTDVAEPPATPDAPSVSPSPDASQTALNVAWTAPANTGPPITGYDLRYREQGEQAWSAHAVRGAATSTTIAGLDPGTVYEVQVAATNDEGASDWSDSGTGSTRAESQSGAPRPLSAFRSVVENAPAGTAVGAPIDVAAPAGATLTYSLSGSGAFTIDASTGQIRVATGAVLDHETTQSYTVAVTVTGGAATVTAEVTITVTDVAEPPATPDAPSVSPSPDASQTALDVAWTAPANTGPPITGYDLRYREQGEQAWSAHAVRGAATSSTIAGLDPGTVYEVQVAATNDEGTSDWSDSGTGSTRAESQSGAPRPLSALRSVVENAPAGTAVGAPIDVAAPAGATLTFSLAGSSAFTIDAATGQILVAAGAALDHESTQSYSVTLSVTGGADGVTVSVTIRVTDANEPPPRPDAPSVATSSSAPTSELDVTWSAPDMTGKPPITAYDLGYREADGGSWTEWTLDGSRTSTTIAGLQADTTYQVRIRARNDEGVSPWSNTGEGSTEAQPRAPQESDQPDQPEPPDDRDQPETPEQPDTPNRPSTPDSPGAPDVTLGPGGPVTPGPGEPGTPLGPDGPSTPASPNPGAELPSTGVGESGQASAGAGSASNAGASAAPPGTVTEGAASTPTAVLLAVLGPVDRAVAGAAGVGTLALVAVLAGLHALIGGLTKPLGLGTALLIPLLVPARRRRKKRAAEETPDTATPASAPGSRGARHRRPWVRHGRAAPGDRHGTEPRTTRRSETTPRNEE